MRVTFEAAETETAVSILDDIVIESIETFLGLLTSSEPNVMIGDGTATVTILDNDGYHLPFLNKVILDILFSLRMSQSTGYPQWICGSIWLWDRRYGSLLL